MFTNYLKIAFRNLLKYKGYSLINIAGLAIGMTCCFLILLFVADELSYDRYHENADRIYRLERRGNLGLGEWHTAVTSDPWGRTLVAEYPAIIDQVLIWPMTLQAQDRKRQYSEQRFFFTQPSIFRIFTLPLLEGDPATALSQPNAVVLTPEKATRFFGDRNPIGQMLPVDLDGETLLLQVTGVMQEMPRNSHFVADFLVSYKTVLNLYPRVAENWLANRLYTYLLLHEDASFAQVREKLPTFVEKYMAETVMRFNGVDTFTPEMLSVELMPLQDIHLRSEAGSQIDTVGSITTVYVFLAIAFLILAIGCINFMNLSTARSERRAKEVGLRKVVGAGRSLLVRQFLGESIAMAVLAFLLAIACVELLLPFFRDLIGKPLTLSFVEQSAFIFGFLAIAIAVGAAAGIYPAFYLSAFEPARVLKSGTGGGRSGAVGFRRILVVVQFVISIILIVGTLVIGAQLDFIQNKSLGFSKDQILVVRASDQNLHDRYQAIKPGMLQHPRIGSMTVTSRLPGQSRFQDTAFEIEGSGGRELPSLQHFTIDYDFVPTYGIDMVAGRNLSRDFATDAEEGFLINEEAVAAFGYSDPEAIIGKQVSMRDLDMKSGRIVGVVKNFHFRSLHSPIEPLAMVIYPRLTEYISFKVSTVDLDETVDFLRQEWQGLSPNYPFDYWFLDQEFERRYQAEQKMMTMFRYFAGLAILVAGLGLFGLVSFTVERRAKEVGIRKVLGASVAGILTLLTGEFVRLVLVANLVAWPIAYLAMNHWLQNFAYRIEPGLTIFVGAAVTVLGIATLTVCLIAFRTATSNPVDALRYE